MWNGFATIRWCHGRSRCTGLSMTLPQETERSERRELIGKSGLKIFDPVVTDAPFARSAAGWQKLICHRPPSRQKNQRNMNFAPYHFRDESRARSVPRFRRDHVTISIFPIASIARQQLSTRCDQSHPRPCQSSRHSASAPPATSAH
jgi:hypothetical protein